MLAEAVATLVFITVLSGGGGISETWQSIFDDWNRIRSATACKVPVAKTGVLITYEHMKTFLACAQRGTSLAEEIEL